MKRNITLMKEYSDWLFEENSIIYEKKHLLTEDAKNMLLDLGQFALGVVGAIPIVGSTIGKIADVANGAIYAARGEYVFALLSFICAALPPIADSLAEGGVLAVRLATLAGEGAMEAGVGARIARQIIEAIPQIRAALSAAVPWLKENKEEIKAAIQAAADRVKESRNQRERSSSSDDVNANIEDAEVVTEAFVSDAISGSLTALTNLLLSNDRIRELLTNEQVVNGLKSATDQIIQLLERAQETFNEIESENSETATSNVSEPAVNSPGSVAINEHIVYSDIRFKRLARITD